jgi:hypothetical protein
MKARQLIRYQQWKFSDSAKSKDVKEQQLALKAILDNRY